MIKLYHIPNIVLGIKLKNMPVEFVVGHLSIRYFKPEDSGSFVINNESPDLYIYKMLHGALIIEKSDDNFNTYDTLSNTDLNCIGYSYSDIDKETITVVDVLNKLENLIEENLTHIVSNQNIEISSVSIECE